MAGSGFVLKEAVDELSYNFEPHGGKGPIPEPTADQIKNFRKNLAELMEQSLPDTTAAGTESVDWARRVVEFIGRDTSEITEKLLQVIADVCSDSPSFDDLKGLPYRAQQAFIGWITGTFLLPSIPMPGTTA